MDIDERIVIENNHDKPCKPGPLHRSALVPVYWCRNAKVAQPILRADSKISTLRSVANITITLNVDWMAGAGMGTTAFEWSQCFH